MANSPMYPPSQRLMIALGNYCSPEAQTDGGCSNKRKYTTGPENLSVQTQLLSRNKFVRQRLINRTSASVEPSPECVRSRSMSSESVQSREAPFDPSPNLGTLHIPHDTASTPPVCQRQLPRDGPQLGEQVGHLHPTARARQAAQGPGDRHRQRRALIGLRTPVLAMSRACTPSAVAGWPSARRTSRPSSPNRQGPPSGAGSG